MILHLLGRPAQLYHKKLINAAPRRLLQELQSQDALSRVMDLNTMYQQALSLHRHNLNGNHYIYYSSNYNYG